MPIGPHGFGGRPPMRGRGGPDRPEAERLGIREVLRRFWPFIHPYRLPIAVGTGCVVAALMLEKVRPLITRYLVDKVLTPAIRAEWSPDVYAESLQRLGYAVGAMLVVSVLATLISRFHMRVMRRAGAAMVLDIRLNVYRHLQKLSLSYYESRQTGEIMSRVTGDVGSMEQLVTHVSDHIITDVLNLVVTLAILFTLSWRLGLVALIPVPVLLVLMTRFARVVRPVYREIRNRMGGMNAKLQDNLAGIRVIKAFHTEAEEADRFESENRSLFDMQMDGVKLWSNMFPLLRFIQGSGHIMVTAAGGYMLLQENPSITLGDLFAFNAYVIHLYQPIGSLFRMYDVVLRSTAAGERVVEVLNVEPDVADEPDAVDLPPVEGRVCFENVSFAYASGEEVLCNVNITAEPGQVVALVGRSGAGKTSITNLIPRFYDPAEGRITIDGHDVKHVTQTSLRRQVAIVLQDPFLFNGTVAENIRYGRHDASDEEIRAAAVAAHADEFVSKLPSQYDTEIGERGVKLSGGQKQRISIARALLADRRILILDEATSMVDTESEILIQGALEELMRGRTTFVIAHRLSTVRNADQIVALEDGRIVEHGDHETLIAKDGTYAQMYYAQFQLALEGEGDVPSGPGTFRSDQVRPPSFGDGNGDDMGVSSP